MVRQKQDPAVLVKQFADETVKQTNEIFHGTAGKGNQHAKRRVAAFKKLRAMGDPGRDALAVLLSHENPDVRSMAAVYLLRYRTAEALAVLREVARGKGLVAFEAEEAIKRWEEGGTWELDPPDDEQG